MPFRVPTAGLTDLRQAGLGARDATVAVIPTIPTEDYYTSVYELLKALKANIQDYITDPDSSVLSQIATWNLGYVFPNTVFPAIAIFPISKSFSGGLSDGTSYADYRITIDIYSKRLPNLSDAKDFCLNCVEEISRAIKKQIHLPNDGKLHCIKTEIVSQTTREYINSEERNFQSSASILVSCKSYHQLNPDTLYPGTVVESSYREFLDRLQELLKADCPYTGIDWVYKTNRPTSSALSVISLPGDEELRESRTNGYGIVSRPVTLCVVSRGFPKIDILRSNLLLADNLVSIIERNRMVEGLAQECTVSSIGFVEGQEDAGFCFASTIQCDFLSRQEFPIKYGRKGM
jgi:hypothetical protein